MREPGMLSPQRLHDVFQERFDCGLILRASAFAIDWMPFAALADTAGTFGDQYMLLTGLYSLGKREDSGR